MNVTTTLAQIMQVLSPEPKEVLPDFCECLDYTPCCQHTPLHCAHCGKQLSANQIASNHATPVIPVITGVTCQGSRGGGNVMGAGNISDFRASSLPTATPTELRNYFYNIPQPPTADEEWRWDWVTQKWVRIRAP